MPAFKPNYYHLDHLLTVSRQSRQQDQELLRATLQPQLRASESDQRGDEIAGIVAVLKAACDRDWSDETPIQVANIAANAIHFRDNEIKYQKARAEKAEAELDAHKRDFIAELDGNAAIRKMFNARDNESFFAFIQRLAIGSGNQPTSAERAVERAGAQREDPPDTSAVFPDPQEQG